MNVERRPCVFVGITLLSATASFARQVKTDFDRSANAQTDLVHDHRYRQWARQGLGYHSGSGTINRLWAPNTPPPMHFHDKDIVVAYRYDGSLKSTTPDGRAS